MIDVDKIQIGDKLKVLCPQLVQINGADITTAVDTVESSIDWITEGEAELAELTVWPEDFTLVATGTKYSDLSEGMVVEITCLSDEQIAKWNCEGLLGKQGIITKMSQSVHVDVDGEEWCLQPENLRIVKQVNVTIKPGSVLTWTLPDVTDDIRPEDLSEPFFDWSSVRDIVSPESKKIKSDGGSSSYYDIPIPKWLAQKLIERYNSGQCYIKTEEIIKVRYDNDFDFGNADKSLHRAFQATKGGGKEGNDVNYDLNKVKYSIEKIRQSQEDI